MNVSAATSRKSLLPVSVGPEAPVAKPGTGPARAEARGPVDVFEPARVAGVARGAAPDKVNDGMLLGAGNKTYPAGTPLSQVEGVKPSNGAKPSETVLFINGIKNDVPKQGNYLQTIADATGANVVGIHNATEGTMKDLLQALGDKLDLGRNAAVDSAADTVYRELKAGRGVHLMAHSQGAIITSRALSDVKKRLMVEDGMSRSQAEALLGKVKVETFGGAASQYPDGPKYVHYVNRTDPVVAFGLGAKSGWPGSNPGRDAVVHRFTNLSFDPKKLHSFGPAYLPHRVPFDEARAGRF